MFLSSLVIQILLKPTEHSKYHPVGVKLFRLGSNYVPIPSSSGYFLILEGKRDEVLYSLSVEGEGVSL